MYLSRDELSIIENQQFLLTKATVIQKIWEQLENTLSQLKSYLKLDKNNLSPEINCENGKISRGENYQLLPYLILDFPSHFDHEHIFAYRTMFWWGHFFSFTLHLQGKHLDKYRNSIVSHLDTLLDKNLFICVGTTPWQYHYGRNNYVQLEPKHIDLIQRCEFLKLSFKIELVDYQEVPKTATKMLALFLSILKT